jgi:hypothetical protein
LSDTIPKEKRIPMKKFLLVAFLAISTTSVASAQPKYDASSSPASIAVDKAVKASLPSSTTPSGCYLIDTKTGLCTITYVPGSVSGDSGATGQ